MLERRKRTWLMAIAGLSIAVFASLGAKLFARADPPADRAISGAEDLNLSPEMEQQLVQQANRGSIDAARRLALFYNVVKLDVAKTEIWWRAAAQRNDPLSQYNLGMYLLSKNEGEKRREGISWLEKASKSGDGLATDVLKQVKSGEFR